MTTSDKKISFEVIKRLPRYYRYLGDLLDAGITRISSQALGKKMKVTASQIRQDLNCFGGFGQQGYGYNVEALYNAIGEILGLNNGYKIIIVGAGHLGQALINYKSFERRGFTIIGVFDVKKELIGKDIGGHKVLHMDDIEEFAKENKPDIAVLSIPKTAAKSVAKKLISCGIKGFMNFCYVDIDVPKDICVENIHLSDTLMTLSYRIKNNSNDNQ
ncbi:MAG: redox-sensing transcriptional repressor Rex [Clostridia bacterium]|nr:redox-sensing transcriptional repressor Rex [Clostridia bacterium]